MNILITGGTGYIGSHTAIALICAGHQVVLYDNLSNSQLDMVSRLEKIVGKSIAFVLGDVINTPLLIKTFEEQKIDGVIHCAGLKSVNESILQPIKYYANNVQGTISLLQAMLAAHDGQGIKNLVFSSSATVYGIPQYLPLDEDHPTSPINPYGRSKIVIEGMLTDLATSDSDWRIVSLRYFNPAGAHESGLIGEEPIGTPNNLMPFILNVIKGKAPVLHVFGNDYNTIDGTGVRDYVHVMDLAEGHLAALDYLSASKKGHHIFNLGTGHGLSVLEIVKAFELKHNNSIPINMKPRRAGDVATCYAKVDKSKTWLHWQTKRSIDDIVESSLNSQLKKN